MEHRTMVNLIAAYGCSFTEGVELPDEQFIKSAEKKKRKLGYDRFQKKHRSILDSDSYRNAAINLAWPKHVADMYGVDYHNNALGGTSLENACYKITLDLKRKIIDSNSLILIGLPNVNRWVWPRNTKETHYLSNMLEEDTIETRAFLIAFSDAKLLHYYYSNLEYLDLIARRFNLNIKAYGIWEDIPNEILRIKDQVSLHYYEYMKARWDILKEMPMFNWKIRMSDFSMFPDSTLGGGHFCLKVHEDFAKFVYNDNR